MRQAWRCALAAAALTIGLAGCAERPTPPTATPGGAEGLAAALVGARSRSAWIGLQSGALVGALAGFLIGRPLAVRGGEVTAAAPQPPAGYGLYLYILPGRRVDDATLAAIARAHCARLLPSRVGLLARSAGDERRATALFVLPVREGTPRGTATHVDVALAHDLLRLRLPAFDPADVHVLATAAPLIDATARPDDRIIRLARMAPPFMAEWLLRLADQVEAGRMGTPDELDLRLRSVLWRIGAAGSLVGIQPAAAQDGPACAAE